MAFLGIKGLFMARCQAHNDNVINVLEEIIDFKIIFDGTFCFAIKRKENSTPRITSIKY